MPYIHQSEAWGRSIFPPAPIINGVQLLPLSIGHLALLDLLDVGIRLGSLETAGGALVEGLAVCSQSFFDAVEKIKKGDEVWQKDLDDVGSVACKMPVASGISSFNEYLQDSQDLPVYYQKQNGSSKRGSDIWMAIKTSLQSRLHLTDHEIMTRPISQCIAEHFSIAESDGWMTMESRQESDFIKSDEHKHNEKLAFEIAKKVRGSNG